MEPHKPENQEEAFEAIRLRFIANIPPEELNDPIRLYSQLEQAWWYYEDVVADHNNHIPHIPKFPNFLQQFVTQTTILPLKRREDFEKDFAAYNEYKHMIPVFGGVLLSADLKQVLLVNGFNSKPSWGFPKGKVNQNEDPVLCALREVKEETGFDALEYFHGKRDYDMLPWKQENGKSMGLFIIPNVPTDFPFKPIVQKEIAAIQWFNLEDLPKAETGKSVNKKKNFWGAYIFLSRINHWVAKHLNLSLDATSIMKRVPEIDENDPKSSGEFRINIAKVRLAMQQHLM